MSTACRQKSARICFSARRTVAVEATIFGRITEAHDTLTSKSQRPEYDAYLLAQDQSRGIESLMESVEEEVLRAAEELKREVEQSTPPPIAQLAPKA